MTLIKMQVVVKLDKKNTMQLFEFEHRTAGVEAKSAITRPNWVVNYYNNLQLRLSMVTFFLLN